MKILMSVCVLAIAANAFGQQPAVGGSDFRTNMKVGQNVTVRLIDGSELKGSVMELTETQLAIATGRGTERLAAPRIQEVSSRRRDSLWNGLILGAAGGALLGWSAMAGNDCDYHECGESAMIPGGIVIGAAFGVGIDWLRREKQILYRAPQSRTSLRIRVLTGQVRGARVSWQF